MTCGFCQRVIPESVGAAQGEKACGRCLGGCKLVHCPYCGYGNPVPGKYLRRLLKKDKDQT